MYNSPTECGGEDQHKAYSKVIQSSNNPNQRRASFHHLPVECASESLCLRDPNYYTHTLIEMSGRSWLMDGKRIATKIKSASENFDPKRVTWKSNPSRACPNCSYIIDNSDVTQEWPGLPSGVKFDPSDQEIISHLLAKVKNGDQKPHPFIEEFIPTVSEEDGICYTHPKKLPGVKQDGSVSHFFHRTIKAYNTGTRKRRKIHGDDLGDVRWHKTGRTKPVFLDGSQMGCKKIMVLYTSTAKSGKPEKTNWVMHQYHLGTGEEENEGEFVVSKVFYQQQAKSGEKAEQDPSCDSTEVIITKVDPVTPKSMIPEPPRAEECNSGIEPGQEHEPCLLQASAQNPVSRNFDEMPAEGVLGDHNSHIADPENCMLVDGDDILESQNPFPSESQNLLSGESLYLLDSEQLAEGMSLCDEFLQSQPSSGEGHREEKKNRPCLSDYSVLGVKALKMDLEETHNLVRSDFQNDGTRFLRPCVSDHVKEAGDTKQEPKPFQDMSHLELSNIELDTPPEFRLSQLEFGSQDSFSTWAGSKFSD